MSNRTTDQLFGVVPWTWYEGYIGRELFTCPCEACVYERQRRALEDHLEARNCYGI